MARKLTISYASRLTESGRERSMSEFYLATTSDVMRFYCFDEPKGDSVGKWTLIDRLDRTQLIAAGDKATAKEWAKRLGLKGYTYVKV